MDALGPFMRGNSSVLIPEMLAGTERVGSVLGQGAVCGGGFAAMSSAGGAQRAGVDAPLLRYGSRTHLWITAA